MKRSSPFAAQFALCVSLSVLVLSGVLANAADTSEKERELLTILKSDAAPEEKAVTCKKLAIYGSDLAVPALAPLLADERLSSWARIALEAIPGPAADKALRDAATQLHGRILVGVLNSIGARRDANAAEPLIKHLASAEVDVAIAAAAALGRIAGNKAEAALRKTMLKGKPEVRTVAAQGRIRCAEQFLAQGKPANAQKIYDSIRTADLPKQRVLEATRGAILARGDLGIPMLLEQLRSDDKDMRAVALRTARELPGKQATDALAQELFRIDPKRRPMLLLALADRGDAAALPTIVEAAKIGSKSLRLTAFGQLEKYGDLTSIPVLLAAANDSDSAIAHSAKGSLARLQAPGTDGDICRRLDKASGKTRQVLIEMVAQRRIEPALPAVITSLEDKDIGTRNAAVQAVGIMGDIRQMDDLVALAQRAKSATDREEIETALLAIASRTGKASVPSLLKLTSDEDSNTRITGLHALASAGGSEALGGVRSLLTDKDEGVQDEAVRTLSSWPNTWPEDDNIMEPLLTLSKTAKKSSHQVLALRGYLQYVQGEKKFKAEERVAKLNEALPLLQRPEDKRLAISVINSAPGPGMLEILSQFATDPTIADDACSSIVEVAGKNKAGLPKEERQKALQMVVDKCGNDSLKKQAEEALKKI